MNVRVLLVDEDDDARAALEQRLRRVGHLELVGAASRVEAVSARLLECRPDVVLLDVHRHDTHGVDACRALRQLTDAPVVVLISFMTPELWAAAQAAGAADYLLKHVDTDLLSREISRLAERHGHRSSVTQRSQDSSP